MGSIPTPATNKTRTIVRVLLIDQDVFKFNNPWYPVALSMTLTTHAAIGAAIGSFVGNPALGFALGVSSHLLVDMIPHGDSVVLTAYKVKKKKKAGVAYVMVDAAIAIMFLMFLVAIDHAGQATSSLAFAAAVMGSVLPDLLTGLHELYPTKIGHRYYTFHFFFHDFVTKRYGDVPLIPALVAQAVFVLATIPFIR